MLIMHAQNPPAARRSSGAPSEPEGRDMRRYRCVLVTAGAPSARSLDMSKVTCRAFIASGHDSMAAMIIWLRGYHSGKLGVVTATDTAEIRGYGGRLGRY